MNEQFIKELKGFSGCKIYLFSNNNIFFVRKISKNKEYNERLIEQMMKQIYFLKNIANKYISTSKVLCYGYKDDLFYFDMEYIKGNNLTMHIKEANFNELKDISDKLVFTIKLMKSYNLFLNKDLFTENLKKINDIMLKENMNDKNLIKLYIINIIIL